MKKVLSLVLTLALVLSSFSMAFADDAKKTEAKVPGSNNLTDVAGNANEEAIGVVNDLGIVTGNPDGTFQPTKAVTRAEFAAMLTRALAIPQSALAGYATTAFKDTDGYGWAVGYLAFCNSKGIMLGDGYGNAMPGKTVTLNEAITMTLRAIGYTANSSELKGNWPASYVTKAQELRLYEDVAKDLVGLDKANAAQLVYNALTVQKVAVNTDGKTDKLWDKEPSRTEDGVATTLLSAGLNCKEDKKGVVQYESDTLINIAKHVGKYGTIYRNKDKKVVAFISDSEQLTGRFIKDTTVTKFVTTDGETEYTVADNYTRGVFKDNGKTFKKDGSITRTIDGVANVPVVKLDDTAADLGLNTLRDPANLGTTPGVEFTISADVSGKTIKEIYSAMPWTVTESKKVKELDVKNIVADKEILGYKFKENDNKELDYTQFQLVGAASLKDIKANDVVYVYADGTNVRKIEVGNKVVEGVIKNFKTKKSDSAAKFNVGDTVLKNATETVNGVAGGGTVAVDNVSDEVKAFLDARGYVYDFEKTKTANNFAVVKAYDSGINEQAKLMLADGTTKVVNFDKKDVTPFGENAGDKDIDGLNLATTFKYPVIGYGLNKSGDMDTANKFYAVGDVQIKNKRLIKFVTAAPAKFGTSAAEVATLPGLNDVAEISKDVVVFSVDKDGSDYTDIAVSSIDKVEFNAGATNQRAVVLFDKKNNGDLDKKTVVAILILKDNAGKGNEKYAVINEYERTVNGDDKAWQLKGWIDGQKLDAVSKAVSSSAIGDFLDGYKLPKKGDGTSVLLYKVVMDSKNVMTKATKVTADITQIASVAATDGRNYADDNAIRENAVFYELTSDDEFRLTGSDLKAGYKVWLYDTDKGDDAKGAEVVIFEKP